MTNDSYKNIRENYEAFYTMTLSVAMLSDCLTDETEPQAKSLIKNIGDAYALTPDITEQFEDHILGRMMRVSLATDYVALSSLELLESGEEEYLPLYEIKGSVIEAVNTSNSRGYIKGASKYIQTPRQLMKYESFHHEYDSVARFEALKLQSAYGDVNSTWMTGISYYLGIGCAVDTDKAITYLKRSLCWDHIPSSRMLYLIYENKEDHDNASLYRNIHSILKNADGKPLTDILKTVNDKESKISACILLIHEIIVRAMSIYEIDIAFSDILMSDIPFDRKLTYIYEYRDMGWKNELFGIIKKNTRIGF